MYFGYPVNWIIEYHTSGTFPVSITSNLPFVNGIYAGSFEGRARAFNSDSLTLFKGTFDTTYIPRPITSANFYTSETVIKGQ